MGFMNILYGAYKTGPTYFSPASLCSVSISQIDVLESGEREMKK